MATSPFPVDMAMAVDLWRRNFNPKVFKQPQAAKMLSVCVFMFFSQVSSVCCAVGNVLVQGGTESVWLYGLF